MSHDEKQNKNDSTFVRNHEVQSGTHDQGATSEQINPAAAVQRMMAGSARPADVIQLQRTIGNRAVTGMIQRLAVTPHDDKFEQEANKVSEQVSRMPEERVARTTDEDVQLKRIQRDTATKVGLEGGVVGEEFQQKLSSIKGSGQAVDPSIRSSTEQVVNRDLSNAEIIDNSAGQQLASEVGAKAFTHGNSVVLGKGASANDKPLIAHELTHVTQQGADNGPLQAKRIQRDVEGETDAPQLEDDTMQLTRIQREVEGDEEEFD